MLRSKTFSDETTQVEEWYQTKYHVEPLPTVLLTNILRPSIKSNKKSLGLPPPNLLIPKNFDIHPKNHTYSKKPTLLKKWNDTELWY